ncbi:MAG: InlB B-repeat-containing protein, partial [Oscillospiraceae bacterium]|nr:InlB B-repeat-containing protein [Oscillospiraceae bacterium]
RTDREYMIFFFTGGGTEVDDIICRSGEGITAPGVPVKDGYVFIGWNKEIPPTMPAHDMCIDALWARAS